MYQGNQAEHLSHEPRQNKTGLGVSNQLRQEKACKVTEATSLKFGFSKKKGVYYMSSKNEADQLCNYCTADLCLCRTSPKASFLIMRHTFCLLHETNLFILKETKFPVSTIENKVKILPFLSIFTYNGRNRACSCNKTCIF